MTIARCTAMHTATATTLRFGATISIDSTRWLVDEITHARTYLRHRHVMIEINSSGGDAEGLEYWLHHAEFLTSIPGFTLSTRAIGNTSSAAAILLSQGSLGYRSAVPSAKLLYHGGRVINTAGEVWTADRLQTQYEEIAAVTARILEHMVLHRLRGTPRRAGARGAPAMSHTELLERYTALFSRDTPITPAEACEHGLIDFVADY